MIDWFLLLTPILLLLIMLFFAFLGCDATFDPGPVVRVIVRNTFDRATSPVEPNVLLSWTIENGEGRYTDSIRLDQPDEHEEEDADTQTVVYRHVINRWQLGEWTIRCAFLTLVSSEEGNERRLEGVACCEFTLIESEQDVTFEVESDDGGGFVVRVPPGGCPGQECE